MGDALAGESESESAGAEVKGTLCGISSGVESATESVTESAIESMTESVIESATGFEGAWSVSNAAPDAGGASVRVRVTAATATATEIATADGTDDVPHRARCPYTRVDPGPSAWPQQSCNNCSNANDECPHQSAGQAKLHEPIRSLRCTPCMQSCGAHPSILAQRFHAPGRNVSMVDDVPWLPWYPFQYEASWKAVGTPAAVCTQGITLLAARTQDGHICLAVRNANRDGALAPFRVRLLSPPGCPRAAGDPQVHAHPGGGGITAVVFRGEAGQLCACLGPWLDSLSVAMGCAFAVHSAVAAAPPPPSAEDWHALWTVTAWSEPAAEGEPAVWCDQTGVFVAFRDVDGQAGLRSFGPWSPEWSLELLPCERAATAAALHGVGGTSSLCAFGTWDGGLVTMVANASDSFRWKAHCLHTVSDADVEEDEAAGGDADNFGQWAPVAWTEPGFQLMASCVLQPGAAAGRIVVFERFRNSRWRPAALPAGLAPATEQSDFRTPPLSAARHCWPGIDVSQWRVPQGCPLSICGVSGSHVNVYAAGAGGALLELHRGHDTDWAWEARAIAHVPLPPCAGVAGWTDGDGVGRVAWVGEDGALHSVATRVLTNAQLRDFAFRGMTVLRGAFPSSAAAACCEQVWAEMAAAHGVLAHDRSTWQHPLVRADRKFPTRKHFPDAAAARRAAQAQRRGDAAGVWAESSAVQAQVAACTQAAADAEVQAMSGSSAADDTLPSSSAAAPVHAARTRAAPAATATASVPCFAEPAPPATCWDLAFSDRLAAAYSDVAGHGRWWCKGGVGWWPVTFPGFVKSAWRPPAASSARWHVDGMDYEHTPWSDNIAVLPIALFTDVRPRTGGTAVWLGSHVVAAQLLAGRALHGRTAADLEAAMLAARAQEQARQSDSDGEAAQGAEASADAADDGSAVPMGMNFYELRERVRLEMERCHPSPTLRSADDPAVVGDVVEVCGQAGDVALLHPLVLHAGSDNASSLPRVISNAHARLAGPMHVLPPRDGQRCAAPTPVELPVAEALAAAIAWRSVWGIPPAAARASIAAHDPSEEGERVEQAAKRRRT